MEDFKPSSDHMEKAPEYPDSPVDSHKNIRRILLKTDIRYGSTLVLSLAPLSTLMLTFNCRVLPLLALLFLCSFLDRTNVGNAKILGLEKSLHITDHQYSIGLAVFYATYIVR